MLEVIYSDRFLTFGSDLALHVSLHLGTPIDESPCSEREGHVQVAALIETAAGRFPLLGLTLCMGFAVVQEEWELAEDEQFLGVRHLVPSPRD